MPTNKIRRTSLFMTCEFNFKLECSLNHEYFVRLRFIKGLLLTDLVLYVPSTIFQLNRGGSSWVVELKDCFENVNIRQI